MLVSLIKILHYDLFFSPPTWFQTRMFFWTVLFKLFVHLNIVKNCLENHLLLCSLRFNCIHANINCVGYLNLKYFKYVPHTYCLFITCQYHLFRCWNIFLKYCNNYIIFVIRFCAQISIVFFLSAYSRSLMTKWPWIEISSIYRSESSTYSEKLNLIITIR